MERGYFRYGIMSKTLPNGTILWNILRVTINDASRAALSRVGEKSQIEGAFSTLLISAIERTTRGSIGAERLLLPIPFDKNRVTATGGSQIVADWVRAFFQQWAERQITPQIILAWDKLTGQEASADYNGKTKSKTETNAEGTSEQIASGTQAQKFASGLNTASAGTAVKNENTESTEGMTTGKTITGTEQEYAYEYAGNPTEFINVNAGRGVIAKIVDSLYASCIDEEDLYPWEIIEFEEIKA